MSLDLCLYEVRDGVAVVTLNRPERNNGMTGALELAYFARFAEAADDREARAVVVTGAGRSFCPGADLGNQPEPGDEPLPNTKIATTFPLTIDKPLVAAINGGCAGVGLVQALQCDVRFAATQAKFTTAFARRGLIAEYGIAWLLPRIVGQAAATDLLLSGRVFDAAGSGPATERGGTPGARSRTSVVSSESSKCDAPVLSAKIRTNRIRTACRLAAPVETCSSADSSADTSHFWTVPGSIPAAGGARERRCSRIPRRAWRSRRRSLLAIGSSHAAATDGDGHVRAIDVHRVVDGLIAEKISYVKG